MAASGLAIRPATRDDLPALLTLYRDLHPDDPELDDAFALERFSEIDAQPGITLLIGSADGIAVASVTLVVIPNLTRNGAPYALIENVVTAAVHRNQGFAGALIRHALDLAWAADCYKVMLLTGSTNPATLRFYENCGFHQGKTGYHIRRP